MAPNSNAIKTLSSIIGWTYMLCWTASFYPQPILNYRRKTIRGFSIDFALLNILGMSSYAIHNLVLYYSPLVRAQYANRHPGQPEPTVRPNDIVYAVHGALITAVVYSQFYSRIWRFTPVQGVRCSWWTLGLFWGCSAVVVLAALMVAVRSASPAWEWLDVIYLLGNIKAFLTVVKYAPQSWLNYRRKSTQGLSITMFTLDFVGAILSLMQLAIDSASGGDWSAMLANPAKFALGNVTIFFDILSFYQHFVLYRGAAENTMIYAKLDGETEPLLSGHNTREAAEFGN